MKMNFDVPSIVLDEVENTKNPDHKKGSGQDHSIPIGTVNQITCVLNV